MMAANTGTLQKTPVGSGNGDSKSGKDTKNENKGNVSEYCGFKLKNTGKRNEINKAAQMLFAQDSGGIDAGESTSCEYVDGDVPIAQNQGKQQLAALLCNQDSEKWKALRSALKATSLMKSMEAASKFHPGKPAEEKQSLADVLTKMKAKARADAQGVEEDTSTDGPRADAFLPFEALDVDFPRVEIIGNMTSGIPMEEFKSCSQKIAQALLLRNKYAEMARHKMFTTTEKYLRSITSKHADEPFVYYEPHKPEDHPLVGSPYANISTDRFAAHSNYKYKMVNGVVRVFEDDSHMQKNEPLDLPFPDLDSFLDDLSFVLVTTANGPMKSFSFRRLSYLAYKYHLHVLLNETQELAAQKAVPHRDFYNCRKVDTHIHASACMSQKHLLRFMKHTMKYQSSDIVYSEDGKDYTLQEICEELDISPYELSIDSLDVHAGRNTFQRFDKFNAKYNPLGESKLRKIYIKTDNAAGGSYFAELVKEVMKGLEDNKYQQAELRMSIYGRSPDEWTNLAKWAVRHNVYSRNVRWLIQVPRIFDIYCSKGLLSNFEEMMKNLFEPLFEATLYPRKHPELHMFLKHVSGFDSVDDESKAERHVFSKDSPFPKQWTEKANPPYSYYIYYMYANIVTLNQLREKRGMNIFNLRPHCGEAGPSHHLVTSYLLADNISHGLLLRKTPVVQYLYYLHQIGVAMSPLSNNSLFLDYNKNPLPDYLARGLNISLSTDDPLQFHYTNEALMEEYSIAAQVWKLSTCDMCEIARNSILMCGFPEKFKQHWLGPKYLVEGAEGNLIRRSNVPDVRLEYRNETLQEELGLVLGPIRDDLWPIED